MDEALPQLPATETPTPSRDVRWVFLGPNGLRAGWSVLLFALIFAAAAVLLSWAFKPLLHQIALAAGMTPGSQAPMPLGFGFPLEVLQTAGVVVATVSMALIERRPILAYGFQGTSRAIRFLFGLVYGFLAITALVLVLCKAGLLAFDGRLLHGAALWRDALGWGSFFLLVGICEESLLRGYLQYTLTRGLGFWWGALLFSFLFGFLHRTNAGETPVGLFSAGAIGLVFCLSLWYTGSLWWAVGFHAAWDWGESYFYGTSDSGMVVRGHLFAEHPLGNALWSGGPTGPEGSLLVFAVVALVALGMWLWWGSRAKTPFAGAAWKPAKPPVEAPENLPLAS